MSSRYDKYETFIVEYPEPRILRLSFNKPERLNALDRKGHREVSYIWRDIDEDDSIDCVILTGKGRAFSAGGDFDMIQDIVNDEHTRLSIWKEARDLVYNLINCGKPIISAINGPAVGAGLVAALLADISIVGKSVNLTDGHTRLGVAAGDHAVIIWPLLCGMAKAKYYLLTSEFIDGREAERIGLISKAVPAAQVLPEALRIAEQLATGPRDAIQYTKRALNHWLRQAQPNFEASLAYEMLNFLSSDASEGLAALQQRRRPEFGQ